MFKNGGRRNLGPGRLRLVENEGKLSPSPRLSLDFSVATTFPVNTPGEHHL